ncbi:MAG: hypothetical protein LBP64_03245 [Tannerella sp.]|jgi:hypothetical protein|nr:hypothetical protein [Tannerella sp.]
MIKKLFLTVFTFLSLVSGFAAGAAGYGAANSSMPVNNLDNAIVRSRSAVVSPLASGARHIAGDTAVGLIQGQKLSEAFINSFDGIGKSRAKEQLLELLPLLH